MASYPEDLKGEIDKLISNSDFISRFETTLGLDFIPQKTTGNICFAENNDELRDDFKQVFTSADLLNYIRAVLHSSSRHKQEDESPVIDLFQIPNPKDTETFWKLVKMGENITQFPKWE